MRQIIRGRLLAKYIQAVFALAFLGFLGFYQLPSRAQEKENQASPQQQSVERDQAYVRQLLQRGTSDAKVESFLKLSSEFASFNPSSDFHAYALKLIAKEKTALKQLKNKQQSTTAAQTEPTVAVSETPSVVVSGNVTAPSNPVGIANIKASQAVGTAAKTLARRALPIIVSWWLLTLLHLLRFSEAANFFPLFQFLRME